jgi:hypothetical protein
MPNKERPVVRSKKSKSRKVRRGDSISTLEPSLVSLFRLVERKGVQPALEHYPAMAYQLAAIQHMQRTFGNAAVQRYLVSLSTTEEQSVKKTPSLMGASSALQRQKGTAQGKKEPAGEKGEGSKEAAAKEPAFDLDKWISKEVYDLVKSQVGESKLNEYAKSLAKKAGELLVKQMEGVTTPGNMVEKEMHKVIGELFTADVKKATLEIMKSPAGAKLKELILQQARQDPGSVIGLVLTALAFAAASNADIPTIELQKKLGKGYEVKAKAELGKFQDIALKELKLGISYSAKDFQANISGSYSGEKKKKLSLSMREAAAETEEEKKFKSNPNVSSSGDITFDFDLKSFGMKTTYLYGGPKQWMGVWEFRLGEKNYYWAPKVVLGPDQKLTFALGNQFNSDSLQFYSAVFPGKDETSLSHYLKLDKPFGAEGLSVEASLRYQVNEPKVTGAKLAGQYKLLEKPPGHPFPVVYLKFEGAYQAAGPGKPKPDFSGLVVIWGSW